jgi:predicted GTPase
MRASTNSSPSTTIDGYDIKKLKSILKIADQETKDLFVNNMNSKEQLAAAFKSVCALGLTGHGKSHTCNSLSDTEAFKVSADIDSETEKVFGVVTRWRRDPKGQPCIIIDTPGMGDSKGRDTAHIANMVVDLKAIGYVHVFIIAINSEEPRLSEHLQSTIKLFSQMFGIDFFKNVMVCFTKFSNSSKMIKQRELGKRPTKETLIKKY